MPTPDYDSVSYIRFLIASTVVIGLMLVLAWGLKQMAARGWIVPASLSHLAMKQRRLKLVETIAVDPRNRVAIVKCDEREHLILIGATQAIVIDKDIPKSVVPETVQQETIQQDNAAVMI